MGGNTNLNTISSYATVVAHYLNCKHSIFVSVDLGYTDKNANIESLLDEVGAMLYRMFNPEH
jgi:hypothetical protein